MDSGPKEAEWLETRWERGFCRKRRHCQVKSSNPTHPLPLPGGSRMVKLRGQHMMKVFLPRLEFEEPESPEPAWFSANLPCACLCVPCP